MASVIVNAASGFTFAQMKLFQFQITKWLNSICQSITKSKINASPKPMLHYSQSSSATTKLTKPTNPITSTLQATNYVCVYHQNAFRFQPLLVSMLSASHTT